MAEAEGRKEQRGTECLGKLDAPPGHFSLNEKTRDHYCAFERKVKSGSWVSLTDTLRSWIFTMRLRDEGHFSNGTQLGPSPIMGKGRWL